MATKKPKTPAPALQWFTTKHKTQHCHLNNYTWCTVRDNGTSVRLIKWFKGCYLTPHESVHANVYEAKREAEAWLAAQ